LRILSFFQLFSKEFKTDAKFTQSRGQGYRNKG